jgi:hypothetical protein
MSERDHHLLIGLWATLPATNTVWSPADREKWLQAARDIFGLIYRDGGKV